MTLLIGVGLWLLSLVEAMCDLFMGPIRPVIDRLAGESKESPIALRCKCNNVLPCV